MDTHSTPDTHSTLREGLLAGLLGGLVVAAWYAAVDIGRGQPLYTPNVLGQVFLAGDTIPTVHRIVPQAVAEYSLLHFGFFCLLGVALTAVAHLATRNPALRMGVLIGLAVGLVFFLGFLVVLHSDTHERFPWMTAFGGGVLGVGSMGIYLWQRHPGLRSTFRHAPLGDEVKPPPHPPGPPRR